MVQAPQKNVKNKEFIVDSEEKCAKLMYMFNVMLVNRKNNLVASKIRKVDELRVNEERQIKQAAKPQVSERTKQLAELSRQKSKKPSHVPEVVDEEKSDKESPKNQPKRSDSIH